MTSQTHQSWLPMSDEEIEYIDDEYADRYDQPDASAFDGIESNEQILQVKLSSPVRSLREFIARGNFRTEKGDNQTNIIDNTGKSYVIPPTQIAEFFEKLEACRRDKQTMHYAERQWNADTGRTGIAIDFDIYQRVSARLVTSRHLLRIITRIARILAKSLYFSTTETAFDYHVFVISRPAVTAHDSTMYKDGFHLIMPEVRVAREYKKYLIDEMCKENIVEGAFSDIMRDIVKPEKLLDKMSASAPINFVGSAKAISSTAYPLTHAYSVNIDLTNDNDVTVEALTQVDDLTQGIAPDGTPINLVYELSIGFSFEYLDGQKTWLDKQEYEYLEELEEHIQTRYEKRQGGIIDEEELEDNENEVDILTACNAEASYIKKLLAIIDISYATEYEKWTKVIWAIANTNVRYRPLADWFSHRNPKAWSASEVERVWLEGVHPRGQRTPVTKRSIIFWAKDSSPERFREIEQENYINILFKAVLSYEGNLNHAEVARVIHSMVGDKFACDVPPGDKTGKLRVWYEFVLPEQAHRDGEVYKWRREDNPDVMLCFMSDRMPIVYDVVLERIKDKIDQAESEKHRKYWLTIEKKLKASQCKLGDDTYQQRVLKQCQLRFRARGFVEELDMYPDIIGVGNGVLKLGARPLLIQRFHEYRISKFTTTRYRPFNPNNPYIKELLQIHRDIIIEPDAFEYIMLYLSTQIDMAEAAGIIMQIAGGGSNGKSFLTKMLYYTLGEQYIAQFRSELITGADAKAEAANSAKMVLRGKTGAFCDEFNPGEIVNTKLVKAMANPGRTAGRENYENETTFRNTVNPIASTNHRLSVNDTDHGYWRRQKFYEAKVKFTKHPNPNNPLEKPVNPKIMDEYPLDPLYQEAYLSILVHFHQRLHVEYGGDIKRVPCKTIEKETEEYHNQQDSLNRFINLMIVVSPNAPGIILEDLGNEYIAWFKQNVRMQARFDMKTLVGQIVTSKLANYIVPRNDGVSELTGHRLRESMDEPLEPGEKFLFAQPANAGDDDGDDADAGNNAGDDDHIDTCPGGDEESESFADSTHEEDEQNVGTDDEAPPTTQTRPKHIARAQNTVRAHSKIAIRRKNTLQHDDINVIDDEQGDEQADGHDHTDTTKKEPVKATTHKISKVNVPPIKIATNVRPKPVVPTIVRITPTSTPVGTPRETPSNTPRAKPVLRGTPVSTPRNNTKAQKFVEDETVRPKLQNKAASAKLAAYRPTGTPMPVVRRREFR